MDRTDLRGDVSPTISAFIRNQWISDTVTEATARNRALERTWLLDQEWGEPAEEVGSERRDAKRIKQIASGPNDMRLYVTPETARGKEQLASRSRPSVANARG